MTDRRPRFAFYEVVRIRSTAETSEDGIAGAVGAVLGVAGNRDGTFGYAVAPDGRDMVWSLDESVLEATGEHRSPEDYESGASIRVDQRGRIVDGTS